jgi:hypothetical protein
MTFYNDRGQPYQEDVPIAQPEPPKLSTTTIVGLDLGQRADFTALAGVERQQLGDAPAEYRVRRLRRWREIPYTAIRDELVERLPAWGLGADDRLVLDETGVGVAVADMIREAKLPVGVTPVTITAGSEATRVGQSWHVPKRDLVSTVAVLLEQRRIQVADGLPESATLRSELGTFRTKISPAGYDTYGAWREGEHDDLVLAVALAVWFGERPARPIYFW